VRNQTGDFGRTAYVLVVLVLGEAEVAAEAVAQVIAVEHPDAVPAPAQFHLEKTGDTRITGEQVRRRSFGGG
jgi:hypothetical protein